jgi:hypothetical protein
VRPLLERTAGHGGLLRHIRYPSFFPFILVERALTLILYIYILFNIKLESMPSAQCQKWAMPFPRGINTQTEKKIAAD